VTCIFLLADLVRSGNSKTMCCRGNEAIRDKGYMSEAQFKDRNIRRVASRCVSSKSGGKSGTFGTMCTSSSISKSST
jgi:hypothetical protein